MFCAIATGVSACCRLEADVGRARRRVAPRVDAELRQHRGDMVLDGAQRDDELLGDLRVRRSLAHEREDLELAWREARDVRARGTVRPAWDAQPAVAQLLRDATRERL